MEKREDKFFYEITWPSICRNGRQAAAQSNHQYPWEDRFRAIEQEEKGVA